MLVVKVWRERYIILVLVSPCCVGCRLSEITRVIDWIWMSMEQKRRQCKKRQP